MEHSTPETIARRLGIDEGLAEVLPGDEVEAVEKLRVEGRKGAFIVMSTT